MLAHHISKNSASTQRQKDKPKKAVQFKKDSELTDTIVIYNNENIEDDEIETLSTDLMLIKRAREKSDGEKKAEFKLTEQSILETTTPAEFKLTGQSTLETTRPIEELVSHINIHKQILDDFNPDLATQLTALARKAHGDMKAVASLSGKKQVNLLMNNVDKFIRKKIASIMTLSNTAPEKKQPAIKEMQKKLEVDKEFFNNLISEYSPVKNIALAIIVIISAGLGVIAGIFGSPAAGVATGTSCFGGGYGLYCLFRRHKQKKLAATMDDTKQCIDSTIQAIENGLLSKITS